MKTLCLMLVAFCLSASALTFAQDAPVPAASGIPVSVAASPTPAPSVVSVAEPAAPPQWAQDIITTAQKLPFIGPIISKALLYLGIVSSLLTMLVAFLLSALSAISGIANFAGLTALAEKVLAFKNGPVMYWIKFFSLFNAKKPAPQPAAQ